MNRADLLDLQARIEALRNDDEDYLILYVGVHGPNIDCENGNAIATVRMGNDEATCEGIDLFSAITLARSKILRERELRKAQAAKPVKAGVA